MNKLRSLNDSVIGQLLSDSLYDVRPDGTIWTLRSRQGHICDEWRRTCSLKDGYYFLDYGTKSNRKHLAVHRIIYAKFKGPLNPELVINHIDGNPTNNHPDNLELVTQSQNNIHRFRTLNRPAVIGNRRFTDAQILEIRKLKESGQSLSKLATLFQTSKSTISGIVNRKTFKHL